MLNYQFMYNFIDKRENEDNNALEKIKDGGRFNGFFH